MIFDIKSDRKISDIHKQFKILLSEKPDCKFPKELAMKEKKIEKLNNFEQVQSGK